jgi:hypothetical protein
VLGALAVPAIIRQVDQARLTRESADLKSCSEAFTRSILRTRTVPVVSDIPTSIASESSLSPSQITGTPIGTRRGFVLDPALRMGAGLPYVQTGNAGIPTPPTSARLVILSSLARPYPLGSDETNNSVANFNAIWLTGQNAKPVTWLDWKGMGDDLRIERVNLTPLFHRLILVNHDPDHQPKFAINASGVLTDPPTNTVWDAYYLEGSVVDLFAGADLQTRHLINRDISFVFENQIWTGIIGRGAPPTGLPETFARSADQFLRAPWNTGARQGANQLPIVLAMANFMQSYSAWANGCPHFAYHFNPGSPGNIPEYRLLDILGGRNSFLDEFTGTSGLLK